MSHSARKQLLCKQTAEAFRGRPDMPLMAALEGITPEEATWQPDAMTPSIEHLVRHVGYCKSFYCRDGFAVPMVLDDPTVNDNGDSPDISEDYPCGSGWGRTAAPGIAGALDLLERSQRLLTDCLERCADEKLDQPIPNRHGKSAEHFFWIMIMHDLYHAGQIRTRRTMYRKG